jgi:hypothetical protein
MADDREKRFAQLPRVELEQMLADVCQFVDFMEPQLRSWREFRDQLVIELNRRDRHS